MSFDKRVSNFNFMVVDQVSQEISKQFELQHKWNVRVCFFHFKVTYEYEIEYVNRYIVQSTTGIAALIWFDSSVVHLHLLLLLIQRSWGHSNFIFYGFNQTTCKMKTSVLATRQSSVCRGCMIVDLNTTLTLDRRYGYFWRNPSCDGRHWCSDDLKRSNWRSHAISIKSGNISHAITAN